MPIPPFVSDIFYSVQNEDVNSELAVLLCDNCVRRGLCRACWRGGAAALPAKQESDHVARIRHCWTPRASQR